MWREHALRVLEFLCVAGIIALLSFVFLHHIVHLLDGEEASACPVCRYDPFERND